MIKGLGIDIVKIARISDTESFRRRILHTKEMVLLNKITNKKRRLQFLAGRWAVKEAIYKASAFSQKIIFSDINLQQYEDKLQWVGQEKHYFLSLSHEEDYAVGLAILITI